jgi:hypothetical protein
MNDLTVGDRIDVEYTSLSSGETFRVTGEIVENRKHLGDTHVTVKFDEPRKGRMDITLAKVALLQTCVM